MPTTRIHRPDARPIGTEPIEPGPGDAFSALTRLLGRLDEAAQAYSAEGVLVEERGVRANAASPKLWAAHHATFGFLEFLNSIDRMPNADLRRAPVAELMFALNDLVAGRQPPAWFARHKTRDYGGRSARMWQGRAHAA